MSLLDGYKAGKAVATLVAAGAATTPETRNAAQTLKQIGAPAIPRLLSAVADVEHTAVIDALLVSLLDNRTLPAYLEALTGAEPGAAEGAARALAKSTRYDPNRLLDLLEQPEAPAALIARVLKVHRARLDVRRLLSLLDKVPGRTRPGLFQLLAEAATPDLAPALADKTASPDPLVRARVAELLARFPGETARDTLVQLLADPNKAVRQAALEGLAGLGMAVPVAPVCQLLADPDMTVQTKAIETLVALRHPDTVKHLITLLQDESEYLRRAAVEVLNEVGDQRAIKDLLNALRDADWWVKVRAADALGKIGGPKVFDAVLSLIGDPDEFMRRTAVEILNTSKDQRAFDHLVGALGDEDWWVRERAADALGALGDTRAVAPLLELMGGDERGARVAIRALGALGDARAVEPIVAQLKREDAGVRKEAVRALRTLTSVEQADAVQAALTELAGTADPEVSMIAQDTARTLIAEHRPPSAPQPGVGAGEDPGDSAETLMVDLSPASSRGGTVDPSELRAGTMLADRYRVIRKVGEGAFGVVMLVEDTMVRDEIILKFISPHFASDRSMIERFVHELRYARRTTHENVIRIYDFVSFGRSCAISMEYFPSHSLADELKDHRPLELQRGLKIVTEVCSGMSAAQTAGVVHRDLKPANILIDDQALVKVVDFGLAAAASQNDSRLTKTGILVGTPSYMAPEQVRGRAIDSRTDIYALGQSMYELFTGRTPYQGEDSMAVLFQHVEGKAEPARSLNPDLPGALDAAIMKAMAVDPDARYQSFEELRTDLAAIAENPG